MKMKKTDIGVVAVMYIISGTFYAMCMKLPDESQTYPLFTIGLLFSLTTLYVINMIIKARKFGTESGVEESFKGFLPVQFSVSVALILVYLGMMYVLGFYISTIIFMLAALLYLRVPILHTAIATVGLNLLVYVAFTQFLGVKLPQGILF